MNYEERKKIRISKLEQFNSSDVGLENDHIFGFPFDKEESELILIPVPVDVTTSYTDGTSSAPKQVLKASSQLDFYDLDFPNMWHEGIYLDITKDSFYALFQKNGLQRAYADILIQKLTKGIEFNENDIETLKRANDFSREINNYVYQSCKEVLDENKKVALLGGDHSTPFGLYKALSEKFSSFSILQIDAHCDLRKAYEGFEYSHASIMYNALESIPQIEKLVQLGIRDFCEEEMNYIQSNSSKIHTFFDSQLKRKQFNGTQWHTICEEIIAPLGDNVHISFDIDGLMPYLCDGTGTPVAGGYSLEEIHYLFYLIVKSGRKIISFDLVEVNAKSNEFNANVGARALLKLCHVLLASNQK